MLQKSFFYTERRNRWKIRVSFWSNNNLSESNRTETRNFRVHEDDTKMIFVLSSWWSSFRVTKIFFKIFVFFRVFSWGSRIFGSFPRFYFFSCFRVSCFSWLSFFVFFVHVLFRVCVFRVFHGWAFSCFSCMWFFVSISFSCFVFSCNYV